MLFILEKTESGLNRKDLDNQRSFKTQKQTVFETQLLDFTKKDS